jgi:DNA invertase Pin-like site-specific DNA recombinase
MPTYVIYSRKSTDSEDRQVLSLDSQLSELRSLAARQGIAVARELKEAHSAKAPGRPIFTALMRDVEKGKVNGILAWKMDRLARNHLDTGLILQALADGRLERVITIDRTYTRDGNDRFIGNFELGMATKYIDDLRQNVKRGIRAKLQQGWISYRPPLGYATDPATKTIVKDPDRFDLVRRIWDLALTGVIRPDVIRDIANNEWGFRTRKYKRIGGGPIQRATIYRILTNSFYMGMIPLKTTGETLPGAHPPMITREEFQHVQELLGRPGRPRPAKHEFAFTGLMRCGNCGAGVTAEQHVKASGRMYEYYHCTYQKAGVPCREPAISGSALDLQLLAILRRLTVPPRALAWMLKRAQASEAADRSRREEVRLTLQRAVQSCMVEERALLDLRLRSLVTDEIFQEKQQQLSSRGKSLNEKLARIEAGVQDLQGQVLATLNFSTRPAEVFQRGTTIQRRTILQTISLNCQLRARKVLLELNKPFRIVADANGLFNHSSTVDDLRTYFSTTTDYVGIPDLSLLTTL